MLIGFLPAAERLNLLIITTDDMSADSVGAFGCKLAGTTPHMDLLAKEGLRFRYAHVQVGNCMPSRNVMWSGRYPHNNRVEGMKGAGYFTAVRGKVPHSTPYSPYACDMVLDTLPGGAAAHPKNPASY